MAETLLTVRELMQLGPVTVRPEIPLSEALELMNGLRIGALLVSWSDNTIVGIFTERDLLKRVEQATDDWRNLPVSAWMTPEPHTITPSAGWEVALEMMDRFRVRHLPVVENGRVVGILSARMLMRRRAEYLDRQVSQRTRALKLANEELMARDSEQTYNLRAAGRFQGRLLLPHALPDWPELRWGLHYSPLDHLGGDYYDTAYPGPDLLGLLIADASGHSIAAALVAILSRAAFSEVAGSTSSPGVALNEMNNRLQGLADERFVTAFYGVLNRRTRVFTYANAGHPYPLRWVAATGRVEELGAQGFMLGIMPGEEYREKEVLLAPGDRLFFYTDGLIEARNEIGEAYGSDRFKEFITSQGAKSADALAQAILAHLNEFRGTCPLCDDITLVVAELSLECELLKFP